MREFLTIGSSPCAEDCVQVGAENYKSLATAECQRFIDLIREKLGPETGSAKLGIKSFPHDFGSYLEVVCWYDEEDEIGAGYAFNVESNAPENW